MRRILLWFNGAPGSVCFPLLVTWAVCKRVRFRTGRGAAAGDVIGYVRVSTDDQDLEGQRLRLTQAGASRVFTDKL